jgi:hypothetical protein
LFNDCRPLFSRDGAFDLASTIILKASIFVGFDFVAEVAMQVSALLLILVDPSVDRLIADGAKDKPHPSMSMKQEFVFCYGVLLSPNVFLLSDDVSFGIHSWCLNGQQYNDIPQCISTAA